MVEVIMEKTTTWILRREYAYSRQHQPGYKSRTSPGVMKHSSIYGLALLFLFLQFGCRAEIPSYSPNTITSQPEITPIELGTHYQVRIHPEDGLYVGDLVSFEVLAPEGEDTEGKQVEITVEGGVPLSFGPVDFYDFGIGERSQATLRWVWDTSGMSAGEYSVTFSVLPDGSMWSQNLALHPADERPAEEQGADLKQISSECCVIHYVSGTESEDELEEIIEISEQAAVEISDLMEYEPEDQFQLVLLPRVMGHGGFASREVYISYLERNYGASDFNQVLEHEMVHVLDAAQGGELRPTFLSEGLAVHLAGGHFKPEPLMPRAAALLELGWYLPLTTLVEDFYLQQHEIGYLEAGAFVGYMIDRWGYTAFDDFYRDIHRVESASQAEAIDMAMQTHFGVAFAVLEQDFIKQLHTVEVSTDLCEDVQLSVLYFDTVRRYQQVLDPSAYYLHAWLVTLDEMKARQVLADYLRHPEQVENLTLETMLVSAQDHMQQGDYQAAQQLLQAVGTALEQIENGEKGAMRSTFLIKDYHRIVSLLLARGYEAQRITLDQGGAEVLATDVWGEEIELVLVRRWSLWLMQ